MRIVHGEVEPGDEQARRHSACRVALPRRPSAEAGREKSMVASDLAIAQPRAPVQGPCGPNRRRGSVMSDVC